MFSTNDDRFREVEVAILGPDGERRIEMPDAAWTASNRVAVIPSGRRMKALARKIAEARRSEGDVVTAVRVRVWRTDYGRDTFEPHRELVRQSTITVE